MYPKGKLQILIKKSINFRKLEQWLNRRAQVVKILISEKQRHEKCTQKELKTLIKKSIAFHEKEQKLIDKRIEELSQKEESINRAEKFKEVMGIGNACANALVIYLPELGHYPNKKPMPVITNGFNTFYYRQMKEKTQMISDIQLQIDFT